MLLDWKMNSPGEDCVTPMRLFFSSFGHRQSNYERSCHFGVEEEEEEKRFNQWFICHSEEEEKFK